jgi:hypothetical protein
VVLIAAGVEREVEEGEADLRSWPDRVNGFAFSVGGEVTECVEPFQATTVVHCRNGKLPGLSLSFPKCFTGTEICIEHGNWTQYVMMSILAGQEIAHLDCSRNHVDAISKILFFCIG